MNAAVFIDVQNDFVTGALGSKWAQEVAPKIVEFAQNCRNRGFAMYATADTHEETELEGGKPVNGYLTTLEGKKLPIEHCLEGTKGHEIVKGLVKDENGDIIIPQCNIIDKYGFGSLDLAAKLIEDFGSDTQEFNGDDGALGEKLDEIIICGFATNVCILSNAAILRAAFPNVKITVKSELCAGCGVDEKEAIENHEMALRMLKSIQIDVD